VLIKNITIPYKTLILLFSRAVIRIKNNIIFRIEPKIGTLNIPIAPEYKPPISWYVPEIINITAFITILLHTINPINKYTMPITNIYRRLITEIIIYMKLHIYKSIIIINKPIDRSEIIGYVKIKLLYNS
jgi:hypothetical protein